MMSYEKYNSLFRLELDVLEEEKVSGYYSTNEKNELDGDFELLSDSSGISEEFETKYEFTNNSFGQFSKNQKTGLWKYEYVYNDGVDMYEKHTITISFKDGDCLASTFSGQIGYIMPFTEHNFKNQKLCSAKAVREKAWELWGLEYERRKKSGEL